MARPSTFTEEAGEAICVRIARGESLRSICRDDGTPDPDTVKRWRDRFPEFHGRYARAREVGLELKADEIEEIARTPSEHRDDVQHRKLLIDTLKWILSKQLPKQYGDKVDSADVGDRPEADDRYL